MSKHPIHDRAEVAIDFPEKTYMGSFTRHSQFEASADTEGVNIKLVRPASDRREIVIHVHYLLLSDILLEIAKDFERGIDLESLPLKAMTDATSRLAAALEK